MFTLHPQLEKDTAVVGDLPICRVLVDARYSQYPWVILVPRRTGCRELTDLAEADFIPVMEEVRYVHDKLKDLVKADKMNTAALGNVVPQLHFHIIARFKNDEAWPKPVFSFEPKPYADGGEAFAKKVREVLELQGYDA